MVDSLHKYKDGHDILPDIINCHDVSGVGFTPFSSDYLSLY
jgi:hypothetical protein